MHDPHSEIRYGVKVRYVEYEHVLFIMPYDLCNIYGIPYDEHIHWFIHDVPASETEPGITTVVCADDRTGSVLVNRVYEENPNEDPNADNSFYAIVLNYVKDTLGYDLGPLLVDIQTPRNPLEDWNGALIRIEWTTFDE